MTDEQLAAVSRPMLHIPTVVGAVAVVYNLPGLNATVNLAPDVLGDLFLGRITRWNDPLIARTNPDLPVRGDARPSKVRLPPAGARGEIDRLQTIGLAWPTSATPGCGASIAPPTMAY